MQIDKKSNIPKIISGIIATISIIFLDWILLPSFWFWVSLEIIAALLVAVGCSGEWWLHHHPAGRKKKEKDEHHKLESRFIAMVSLGVIIEFFALGHSISEGKALADETAKAQLQVKQLGVQIIDTSNIVAQANERVAIAAKDATQANERTANTESNNLVLQAKVLELEAKSRWRTITPEQEKAFIELTKNNLKLPIRVRMGNGSSAEVQSFASRIRTVLDKAGFEETNADQSITEWPPELNMLWNGIGTELPPIIFLSNPELPGKIIDLRNAQIKLKTYPSYATNTFVKTEFTFVNDDSNPEASVRDENGTPVLCIKVTDRAPFQITAFTAAQNAFNAIGISSGNVTITNIPIGAYEIFVNPK